MKKFRYKGVLQLSKELHVVRLFLATLYGISVKPVVI